MPVPKWQEITSNPKWEAKTPEEKMSIRDEWLNDVYSENPSWSEKEKAELRFKTVIRGAGDKTKSTPMDRPPSNASIPSSKSLLETIGGTAGSLLGPQGTAGGAAIGNVLGQMAEQGSYPPISMGGVIVPGKMPDSGELNIDWMEAGKEGAAQGIMDLGGGLAYRALKKPFIWASETIKPGAKEIARKFKDLYGGELTYGEQTKSFLGDVLQNVAEKSAFGGQTMAKFHELKQAIPLQKGLEKISKDLVDNPQTVDKAGDVLADALSGGKRLKMKALSNSWKAMDDFVGQPAVDMNRKVIPLLQEIIRTAPSGGSPSAAKAKTMLDYFSKEFPDGMVTWERAHIEQSDLFDISQAAKLTMSSVDKANNTKMRSAILKEMGQSAKELSPEAYNAWVSIRKEYAKAMEPYNKKFIKQVANTEGGVNIMSKVFNQKSPGLIEKLRSVVPENKWKDVQAAWLNDKASSLVTKEGLFDIASFTKSIKNMGDSYNAIFKGEQKKAIDHLVDVIDSIGSTGTAGKTGAIFIQMKQSSALAQLGGAAAVGAAAGYGSQNPYAGLAGAGIILGGPWALAKVLTNPVATRYFTRAIKTGTGEAIDNFNKYISKFAARTVGSRLVDEEPLTTPSQEE